jgi:RNA polymerase sigma-70 factor (ECF subfamily)
MVDRSVAAARQLASRARRRVKGAAAPPDADLARQRAVVDAFFAAGRLGDFDALVQLLHPNVVRRSDVYPEQRGAEKVARAALAGGRQVGTAVVLPVIVNGSAGALLVRDGLPLAVLGFTVAGDKIAEIDVFTDPALLRQLGLDLITRSGGLA